MTTASKEVLQGITKAITVELKADEEGSFVALFSTFNVVDHDGDVVVPTAFENGKQVPIGQWNHGRDIPPIGLGTVIVGADGARVEGKLFIEGSQAARDHYAALKGLGPVAEWSYIFNVPEWRVEERDGQEVRILEKIDVWRIDPVDRGASIGTRTETIKSHTPYVEHGEATAAAVVAFVERTKERALIRAKEGRSLGDANVERLEAMHAGLVEAAAVLAKEILAAETPKVDGTPDPNARSGAIRAMQLKAQHARVHSAALRSEVTTNGS